VRAAQSHRYNKILKVDDRQTKVRRTFKQIGNWQSEIANAYNPFAIQQKQFGVNY